MSYRTLFIYDPRRKECAGVSRSSIVQTIDLAPTLLEYFGTDIPKDMEGRPLCGVMDCDETVREYAVFGYHGSQVDVTDGRYVYMLSAGHPDMPVYEYTLMPTHMRSMFCPKELQEMELAGPFAFTKGCQVLKIRGTVLPRNRNSTDHIAIPILHCRSIKGRIPCRRMTGEENREGQTTILSSGAGCRNIKILIKSGLTASQSLSASLRGKPESRRSFPSCRI